MQLSSIGKMARLTAVLALFLSPHLAAAEGAQPCGSKSTPSGLTLAVRSSGVILHAGPSRNSQRLVNRKATEVLKSTQYLAIDTTVTVLEECRRNGWSRIKVVKPDWLESTHIGWVPSDALRRPGTGSKGQAAFTQKDFIWDNAIRPYKKIIISGVNRIHRENPRCRTIDPASAYISDKGTRADPVFFVTCGHGAEAFNVFFSKSDIESGKRMGPAPHIGRQRAISLCQAYARAHAAHPSTVRFSPLLTPRVTDHPDGETSVLSSFTAKNALGVKLRFNLRCLLNAHGLIEGHTWEASN